jgi:KUP system potassium uptake protein
VPATQQTVTSLRSAGSSPPFRLALVVGALGVVFGDIGTSPIYTMQTLFDPADPHPVPISTNNVYGVVSLIFWSVMVIVTLTYITLVMRADNDGEGGIMALITMLRHGRERRGRRTAMLLAGLGLFGASLFCRRSKVSRSSHRISSTGSCRSRR